MAPAFLGRSAWAFVQSFDVASGWSRQPIALIFAVVLGLAHVSFGTAGMASTQERGRGDNRSGLTRQFATLDVRDLNGRRWTAANLRGRVVVLDFWATWCAPCLAEIPWLRRVRERFGPDRLEILGVSLDVTDRRTVHTWLNRNRIEWPQVWEDRGYDSAVVNQFGVVSLPTSLLVDTDGTVVAVNLRGEHLLTAVERLVAASLHESARGHRP
jgi:thiol-disulfide isomerase/thioredoxin